MARYAVTSVPAGDRGAKHLVLCSICMHCLSAVAAKQLISLIIDAKKESQKEGALSNDDSGLEQIDVNYDFGDVLEAKERKLAMILVGRESARRGAVRGVNSQRPTSTIKKIHKSLYPSSLLSYIYIL